MIESGIDLTESGFDLIGIANWAGSRIGSECAQRAEQWESKLDWKDSWRLSETGLWAGLAGRMAGMSPCGDHT